MGKGIEISDRVTRRIAQHLPHPLKRRLAGPYNRLQAERADRAFERRSLDPLDPAAGAPNHVVCVVVDALRADAIGRYTPCLATHQVGTILTTAPWTFPAVTSLVTGRYPHEHGAMRQSDNPGRGATDLLLPPALDEDWMTLPEVFASAGYQTYGGFAFHMPFFALQGRFGTHALYDDAPAHTVLSDFVEWLRAADGPTFSYLHLADLHEPVDPPMPYWTHHKVDRSVDGIRRWRYETETAPGPTGVYYRKHRRQLYRAATNYVDDQIERFLETLEAFDDVAVMVTADHGEGLWERTAFDAKRFTDSRPAYGIDHGGTPYEVLTRVPLIATGLDIHPGERGSLIDIAPTLLAALGQPNALEMSGRALSEPIPADRVRIVEAARYGHEKKAAYLNGWKLLVSHGDGERLGFRVPEERPTELPPEVSRTLTEALPSWPTGTRGGRPVSGLARDRLEDLGYV